MKTDCLGRHIPEDHPLRQYGFEDEDSTPRRYRKPKPEQAALKKRMDELVYAKELRKVLKRADWGWVE